MLKKPFFFSCIRQQYLNFALIQTIYIQIYIYLMQQANNNFNFQAQPQVVRPKAKYREAQEEEERIGYDNIMFEKKVVRGNTYAPNIAARQLKNQEFKKNIQIKHKKTYEAQQMQQQSDQQEYDFMEGPSTPPPVDGRRHEKMQTEEYIEALTDKPQEQDQEHQTDFFIDRPVNRLFTQQKTGIDKEGQIEDGDLFDFDYEVEPILQVLTYKILEQSRMEVLEEEELAVMKAQAKKFETIRNAELAEVQRLHSKEVRLTEENQRRQLQIETQVSQDTFTHKKLIDRAIAKVSLKNLKNKVFQRLEDQGVFRVPLQTSLLDQLVPFLHNQSYNQIQSKEEIAKIIEDNYLQVLEANIEKHKESKQKQMQKVEQIKFDRLLEEQFRQRKKEQRMIKKQLQQAQKAHQDIQDKVQQQINTLEEKQNIFSSSIADIDNFGNTTPFVGLFGGLLGELYQYLNMLLQIQKEETYENLTELKLEQEQVQKLVRDLLSQIANQDGQILFPISQEILDKIQEFNESDQPLTLQSLKEFYTNFQEQCQLRTLIQENFLANKPTFVQLMEIENESLYENIVNSFFELVFSNNLSNIYKKSETQTEESQILSISPNLPNLPLKVQRNDDSIPIDLSQAVFENKYRLVTNNLGEDYFLLNHKIAEQVIRNFILDNLKINNQNLQLEINQRVNQLNSLLLTEYNREIEIFEVDSY